MTERAVSLFAPADRGTRWHTRLRWWWCPFPAIDAEVPRAGDVLEVGCGHGLLSLYLGVRSPARRVTGVDIDARKIEEAVRAAGWLRPGEAEVRFETVAPGYVPTGEWDAIVVADVLYLLPAAEQERLIVAAASALRPGGVVVLKEMGLEPRWKATWNRLQETLATKVVGITDSVGAGLTFVPPETMAGWLRDAGLSASHHRVDHGYPWPHHLVVGRR